MESIDKALDNQQAQFKKLIEILFKDVTWHLNNSDHSQESYRATVRAIFAWVDGMIASLMGRLTEIKLIKDATTVTDDELDHLLDLHEIPIYAGQKRKRFKLDELIKKTLKSFAEACHVDFDFSIHSSDWQKFKDAIEVRNRVTHPKSPKDLEITHDQMKQVADSATWLQNTITHIAEKRGNKRMTPENEITTGSKRFTPT